MTWRNAPILNALHNEANQLGATFLGTVGDPEHQAQGSASDHNPDANGIVHAIDLSYGNAAANWTAAEKIAKYLRANPSQAASIKYLVSNDLTKDVIASGPYWVWRENGDGLQDHRNHVHTSVNSGPAAENDTRPLLIPALRPTPITSTPKPPSEDDVQRLVKCNNGDPMVLLTNSIHARWVQDEAELNDLIGVYGPVATWAPRDFYRPVLVGPAPGAPFAGRPPGWPVR